MKQLKSGYFLVNQKQDGSLNLDVISSEKSAVFASAGHSDWDSVKDAILGTMRASGGKNAVVVDDTKQNIAKETIYYRINENGGLKQFVPTAEEVVEVTEG